jgi:hypothetical protein
MRLFILSLAFFLIKLNSVYFSGELGGGHAIILFILSDILFLAMVLYLNFLGCSFATMLLSVGVRCISCGLFLFYLLDVLLQIKTGYHLSYDLIVRYAQDWSYVFSAIPLDVILLPFFAGGFFFLIGDFFHYRPSVRQSAFWFIFIVTTRVLLANFLVIPERVFSFSQLTPLAFRSFQEKGYSREFQEKSYHSHFSNARIAVPDSKPDVILLVVESLSSASSIRSGGVYDHLPKLDELSKKGTIFTNYLANAQDSEGGFVSMLCQVPPVLYPGASIATFISHQCFQDNAVLQFKEKGYATGLLKLASLDFLDWREYMPLIGFDSVEGRDEVTSFVKAPKYAFKAPPDEYLYREALLRLDKKSFESPFFLTLFTISSHFPYIHPRGGSNSYEGILEYVSEEIVSFYHELEKRNFFENGILVVVGDHRKMYPLNSDEVRRYGKSAQMRTFLSVFGKDIPKDKIENRLLQQSDLLKSIFKIDSTEELTPIALLPLRRNYSSELAPNLSDITVITPEVLENGGGYRATFSTRNEITWPEGSPSSSGAVEEYLHRVRSVGLYMGSFGQRPFWCQPPRISYITDKSTSNGMLAFSLKSSELHTDSHNPLHYDILPGSKLEISYSYFKNAVKNNDDMVLTVHSVRKLDQDVKKYVRIRGNAEACLFIDGVLVASSYPGYQSHISDTLRETLMNKGDRLFQLVIKDISENQTVKAELYSRSKHSEPIGGDDFFVPYVQ